MTPTFSDRGGPEVKLFTMSIPCPGLSAHGGPSLQHDKQLAILIQINKVA